MRKRNAGIKKLHMPDHSSYARVSPDQAAIDEYIAKNGVKEAVNTGKTLSFNGRSKRSVGHAKAIHVRADKSANAQVRKSYVAQ